METNHRFNDKVNILDVDIMVYRSNPTYTFIFDSTVFLIIPKDLPIHVPFFKII